MTFRAARPSLFFVLAAVVASAQANLLTNGSFEDGSFGTPADQTVVLAPGSTTMTGWTVIAGDVAWENAGNPFAISASDGAKFLDLSSTTDRFPFGGVRQSIATVAGGTYRLSFDLGSSQVYGRPATLTVSAGNSTATFSSSPGLTGNDEWERCSLDFVATADISAVEWVATAVGIDYIGLDDADVTALSIPSAVPEPTAAAFLFGGLALLLCRLGARRPARDAASLEAAAAAT